MRYAAPARAIAKRIRLQAPHGVGLIVVPHREERYVAEAIAEAMGWDAPAKMTSDAIDRAGRQVLLGLSEDDDVLRHLNGRRDWLAAREALILIPVPQHQTPRFVTLCADVMATIALTAEVAFEPDATVELAAARRELGAAYRARYGRIDLRGLIRRSESDVGWEIDTVYQPLRASRPEALRLLAREQGQPADDWPIDPTRPLADQLGRSLPMDRPVALLGGPGSGKSFFLRWCAIHGCDAGLFGVDAPLPVLLPLAAFAGGPVQQTFSSWMTDQLLDLAPSAAHALPRAMAEHRAVFLLDGLDEAGADSGRARCLAALAELRASGCAIVVTSRPDGFDAEAAADARMVWVEPFDDPEVRGFLRGWCGQHAIDRGKPQSDGIAEGEKLAASVLTGNRLASLVRTPLLLTVLAAVHRAGARLPEQRIELYQQITLVLVERWNRLRSLGEDAASPAIRVGDAVRLLGAVALDMIEADERGSISESRLRDHLEHALRRGRVRGFDGADAIIAVFRRSLGLIVEHSPGRHGFAHPTLVEYLAALELVRTRQLEASLDERAFDYRWCETILLAFCEVGLVRLDDARLDELLSQLLAASERSANAGRHAVMPLVLGLLQDDPSLTPAQRTCLWGALSRRTLEGPWKAASQVDANGWFLTVIVAQGMADCPVPMRQWYPPWEPPSSDPT